MRSEELLRRSRNRRRRTWRSRWSGRSTAVSERAPASGPIGFVVLVVSAIAIFAQLDAAFDRIWRVPVDPHATWMDWIERLVFQRLKAFGMLMGVGGFIIAGDGDVDGVVGGASTRSSRGFEIGPWLEWAIEPVDQSAAQLDRVHDDLSRRAEAAIRWWDAFRGGLLAAVLWEAGRQALSAYLLHLNYPSAYGIIGSFIAMMLWAYYATLVILFGAEYVRVIGEERRAEELTLETG